MVRLIVFLGGLFLLMLAGELLFFSRPQVPEISYSQFLDRVYSYRIERVFIGEDKIYGLMKDVSKKPKQPKTAGQNEGISLASRQTPWRLDLDFLAATIKKLSTTQIGEETQKQIQDETPSVDSSPRYFAVSVIRNPGLIGLLRKQKIDFSGQADSDWVENFVLNWIVPFILVGCFWVLVSRRALRPPRSALEFGKNNIRVYRENPKTLPRFTDLAGMEAAIERSREIVAFLKAPERFTQLGATLPKGLILAGSPGSGKTLLAKAMAAESGAPLFYFDGPDFFQMFSGEGAHDFRGLINAAKNKAPCILFIDRLDPVLKVLGQRDDNDAEFHLVENMLSRLFAEMDRFDGEGGIVMIAETSRQDLLGPEWRRPGRFNRLIQVRRPHIEGREQLIRKHCEKLVLAPDIDFSYLAERTIGMVAADIANLCNESALLAARCSREKITRADFQEALQKAIKSLEDHGESLTEIARRKRACHESGHILVGHLTAAVNPIRRISIVPRESVVTESPGSGPTEGVSWHSKTEVFAKIQTLLAGRAAEEIVFGEISTGAADDLCKANQLIREALTRFGMSDRLPNFTLPLHDGPDPAVHDAAYSAKPGRILGEEHLRILEAAYQQAKSHIQQYRDKLDAISQRLLENEKIGARELQELLGPRPGTAPLAEKDTKD